MAAVDISNSLTKFEYTSSKDSTGRYMKTNAILATSKGVTSKRNIGVFPIIRYMVNSDNRHLVNEVSKSLHLYRIEKLENITTEIYNILDSINSINSNDKLLDAKDDLENSYKELANTLSFNLRDTKENIIQVNLTKYGTTPNADDINKINSIINDSNLKRIEEKDTETIVKQLISNIATSNQMCYVFSFLQYMKANDKIEKKTHDSLKKQLIDKMQKEWIPRLSQPQQTKDMYSLLSYIDSKNHIDTITIKNIKQTLKKKVASNFKELVTSLSDDTKLTDSYRAEKYIDNIDILQSYISLIQDQKIDISKKRLKGIDKYVVEEFVNFVNDFYAKSCKTSEEKIRMVQDLQENTVIPIIKFISAELARKDYIFSPLSKRKAEKKQNQLLEKALGFIQRNIMESTERLKKRISKNIYGDKITSLRKDLADHEEHQDKINNKVDTEIYENINQETNLETARSRNNETDYKNKSEAEDTEYYDYQCTEDWDSELAEYEDENLYEVMNEEFETYENTKQEKAIAINNKLDYESESDLGSYNYYYDQSTRSSSSSMLPNTEDPNRMHYFDDKNIYK